MNYPEIFKRCMYVILRNEGGYQCNPNDSGNWVNGKLIGTNRGIAARFFPNEDIKNMTIERAMFIYFEKYWVPMNLTGIVNADTILQIFDMGINAGRKTAIILAQKILEVKTDGICGNVTKQAINNYIRTKVNDNGSKTDYYFVDDYITARILYYRELAENPRNANFLAGWEKRVSDTHF